MNNENLKADIRAVIKANGNNEITGDLLQNALISIINQFGSGSLFVGFAEPDTNPTNTDVNMFYLAKTPGIYVNFGGYVLVEGSTVIFTNISGAWVVNDFFIVNSIKSITKTSTVDLVDTYTILFTNGSTFVFTITNGLKLVPWSAVSYLQGRQVFKDFQGYEANANVTSSDIPGVSPKWTRILGESATTTTSFVSPVRTDTYTTNQYFANTQVFTGFGFDYGIRNNFSQAITRIGQVAGSSNPVTEVYMRICETSYTGTVLVDTITKAVTILDGEMQDVTFDFPIIVNATNKNIWVEVWCNGKSGLFKGSDATNVNYRYRTTGMPPGNFANNSTASSGPNNRMYLVLNNVVTETHLKDDLIAQNVELGNTKPVTSDAVAKELDKFDAVIADGYVPTSTVIKGTKSDNVHNSTFVGWGQLWGVLNNFNRVGYLYSPFDAAFIPTTATCRIRTGSSTGPIIFTETKPVTMALNVDQMVYFDLPRITNPTNDEIFISFVANGRIRLMGGLNSVDWDAPHQVKYSTVIGQDTTPGTVSNPRYQMYVEILDGSIQKQVAPTEVKRIGDELGIFDNPDDTLTSIAWLYPDAAGLNEYNIFNENVIIPKYGDNNSGWRTDFSGLWGEQGERGLRGKVTPSLNQTITLALSRGRKQIFSKTQTLLSGALNSGTGTTIDILYIGDSTVGTGAGTGTITPKLKTIFDNDPMDINCIGTLGATGSKHEGHPGWRIADFYGPGRQFYQINITVALTVAPGINSRYTQGANTYNVEEVNLTGGIGYFNVSIVTGSAPTASGVLTKTSGNGDATINYSSSAAAPANKFYNAATGKFDIGFYLTSTSQVMNNNSWIIFQLGINDMFSATDLTNAETRSATFITQLKDMIANIQAYNPTFRIGIVVTIPCANQDAFGKSYTSGQLSEMYTKTGLITLQKKLISEFDNAASRTLKIYLISAHLTMDKRNNFQTTVTSVNSNNPTVTYLMQSNGVHPGEPGYWDIAYMVAGTFKYFA